MRYQNELNYVLEKMELLSNYSYASSIIHWDLETGAPKEGIKKASKVLGFYSGESYKVLTEKKFIKNIDLLLTTLEELDEINKKIVLETKKDIDKIKKIPLDDFKAYSELLSQAQPLWAEAREENDFKKFQPFLEKIIAYNQKYAEYKGYDAHPYNALLDDYEPGMTVEALDIFFEDLKNKLVPLILKINEKKDFLDDTVVRKNYDLQKQKDFSLFIAEYLGFNFDRGMLKESAHPFSMGLNKYDVRMTTRYTLNDMQSSLFGTLHETGHSLYEQNIGDNIWETTLGTGNSMGIHESQSRLYENLIGRSLEFWEPIYPKLQEEFKEILGNTTLEEFHRAINKVQPSLIRVEADELTYSLHIMLRYEIEKQLIEGSIKVEDLPKIWNERMEKYLGITPSTDADGVLQDVHWSAGLFGYFPSYALGSANASQIMNTMNKKIDVAQLLKTQNLSEIKNFLEESIHQYGLLKDPTELMLIATGEKSNSKYYVDYLLDKYSKLYEITL